MLVLSRKVGERVILGNDVSIEIVEIRGNKVRIGFTAPKHIPIIRGELVPYDREEKPPTDATEEESSAVGLDKIPSDAA